MKKILACALFFIVSTSKADKEQVKNGRGAIAGLLYGSSLALQKDILRQSTARFIECLAQNEVDKITDLFDLVGIDGTTSTCLQGFDFDDLGEEIERAWQSLADDKHEAIEIALLIIDQRVAELSTEEFEKEIFSFSQCVLRNGESIEACSKKSNVF